LEARDLCLAFASLISCKQGFAVLGLSKQARFWGVAMEPLRNSVIQKINQFNEDDEGFLNAVDRLVAAEGDPVFPVLLNVLTQLEFSDGEAKEIWDDLLRHRKDMSVTLGRPVKLVTAVCDYFLTVRKSFQNPKVVELKLFEDAHHNSKCDPMTGLYNRGYFSDALSGEISRSKRQNTEFSLIFMDLDNFKNVNDQYGHMAGDLVLNRIADMIQTEKRTEDIAARYGGEELVLLLPGTKYSTRSLFCQGACNTGALSSASGALQGATRKG